MFNLPTETHRINAKMCRNFIFVNLKCPRFVLPENSSECGVCKLHSLNFDIWRANHILRKREETHFFQSDYWQTIQARLWIKLPSFPRNLENIQFWRCNCQLNFSWKVMEVECIVMLIYKCFIDLWRLKHLSSARGLIKERDRNWLISA